MCCTVLHYIPSGDRLELEDNLSLIRVIRVTLNAGLHHYHLPHGHCHLVGGRHNTHSRLEMGGRFHITATQECVHLKKPGEKNETGHMS